MTGGRVLTSSTIWPVGWQTLGKAIITESLRWAAVGLLEQRTTARQATRVQEAVFFVEGSGLDYALETFGIEMDGAVIRHQFHVWLSKRTTPFQP